MLDVGEVKLMSNLEKDKEVKSKYYAYVSISIVIGIIYSSGFYYSFNYLSYFNLYDFESLSIPPIYYIVNAALPTISSILILSLLLFEVPDLPPRFNNVIHNFPVLIFLPLISVIAYHREIISGIFGVMHGIIMPFTLFIFCISLLWNKLSIQDFILMYDFKMQVFCIVALTLLFVSTVGIVGHWKATSITQGDTIIVFNWNGNPPEGIDNKDLVPIFHHDGIYYVTERIKPAPKNPIVHIIPDNQVESAVIKVINKDNISKIPSVQKYNN